MSIISNALFGFEIGNDYFFFDNNSECAVFFIELKCGSVFCDETDTVFLIDGIGKFDGFGCIGFLRVTLHLLSMSSEVIIERPFVKCLCSGIVDVPACHAVIAIAGGWIAIACTFS